MLFNMVHEISFKVRTNFEVDDFRSDWGVDPAQNMTLTCPCSPSYLGFGYTAIPGPGSPDPHYKGRSWQTHPRPGCEQHCSIVG